MAIPTVGSAVGYRGWQLRLIHVQYQLFLPQETAGLALGLNAGLGNFGVTTMQILVPLSMTFGLFGGGSMTLQTASGTLIGKIPAGTETYLQNAGYVWLLFLIPLAIAGWFGMNNIRDEHVSPHLSNPITSFGIIIGMPLIAFFTAASGLWLMLPEAANGSGFGVPKEIVLLLVVVATVLLLRFIPGGVGRNLKHQYKIFKNRHTWIMTVIYTMTFGSFIGYAATFALAIKVVFGYQHVEVGGVMTHDLVNPNGPSALMYAWMGAFIGALIPPLGGMVADKIGGAKVTQIISVVMLLSALGVAYFLKLAYSSATPEQYFMPFLLLFLQPATETPTGVSQNDW